MIQKKKIVLPIILVCILFSFNTFALTPIGNITKFLNIGLSSVGLLIFINHYKKFNKVFRNFIWIFLFLFVLSVLSSHFIHAQPFPSGMIASSDLYIAGTAVLMYYLIMRYNVSIAEIKSMILTTSWVIFFIYLAFFITKHQFISANGEDAFGVESFRKGFIVFGSIIYLSDFFKKNNAKYLLFSILFFSTIHLIDFQRYITAVYLLSLVILILYFSRRAVILKVTIASIVLVPTISLFLTMTETGDIIVQKITDAIELVDNDNNDYKDSSIEARVWQTEIAVKSIEKHPITGVGRIRGDLIEKVAGHSYFYVSDIGLIGILFSFGIFGILAFIMQIRYLFLQYTKGRFMTLRNSIDFKIYILFILAHTVMTGRSINTPVEFVVLVALIEIVRIRNLQKEEYAIA